MALCSWSCYQNFQQFFLLILSGLFLQAKPIRVCHSCCEVSESCLQLTSFSWNALSNGVRDRRVKCAKVNCSFLLVLFAVDIYITRLIYVVILSDDTEVVLTQLYFLQIYGHNYWIRGPRSNQVAKLTLALLEGSLIS